MLGSRQSLIGVLAVFAFFTMFSTGSSSADERAKLRIELQASMQRFIDRSLIEDAFTTIRFEDGSLVRYFPAKAHTSILEGDGYYVLCSDMRNEAGQAVPVDYYMVKAGRGFRVIRTEIANRAPLRSLREAGKLKKL